MQTLISCFDLFGGRGIFNALQSFGVPWREADIDDLLDLEYFLNRSGDKYATPLVTGIKDNEILTDAERARIAAIIYAMYGLNWAKEWATMEVEYNPIQNYDMIETMTDDTTVDEYGRTVTRSDDLETAHTGTDTKTLNLAHAKTGTESEVKNLQDTKDGTEGTEYNDTVTRTPDLLEEKNTSVYGFNSSEDSPANVENVSKTGSEATEHGGDVTLSYDLIEAHTGTDTTTFNTTETDTGTDTDLYNSKETNTGTVETEEGGSDTHTRNYTLERSGNVGVTTSQQMLESERNLWIWSFFRDIVFPDLDKILTIPIY